MWVNKKEISFNRGIKRVVFLQTTIHNEFTGRCVYDENHSLLTVH